MKKLSIVLSLIMCLSVMFALASCSFNLDISGEGESTTSADGKADSLKLLNDFFEETFNSQNYVVTSSSDGGKTTLMTESVKGDSNRAVYETVGTTTYAYKQGDIFYVVVDSEDSHYYLTGENYYNSYYRVYSRFFSLIEVIPEDGGTFEAVSKIKTKDSTVDGKLVTESKTDFTFEFKKTDGSSLNITATAENDLVKTLTVTLVQNDVTITTSYTFEYGTASFELPDITGWEDVSQ